MELKRHYISKKYERKIRLLVTNKCSKGCYFCHNEGMPKEGEYHLPPNELEKFLPKLKGYSNKVVLSGGEPFEYKYLQELLLLLAKYGFDTSINTYLPNLKNINDIIRKVASIHISVPDIKELDEVEKKLTKIRDACKTLQIVLNIPITNIDELNDNIKYMYKMCRKANVRIQIIRLFNNNYVETITWEQRWGEIITILSSFLELSFLESTNREVSYVTQDLVQIDLLDVPCRASGVEYSGGKCLNESDISIDPNLRLAICRWNENSLLSMKSQDLERTITEAFQRSCENCMFGENSDFIYQNSTEKYIALPHYKWPPQLGESVEACNILLQNVELSYYGKSGYIFQLENAFANYYSVPYAFAASSGTAAIYLACTALKLEPEDEVIVPTYSFPTVVTAILSTGARIRVCDTDSTTGNINIESFKNQLTSKVKAVLITHMWGDPVELDELMSVCAENNVKVIEDCSHAYGAQYKGTLVGTFGDIACFSTQANKAVFSGEGGMVLTSSQELYERVILHASSNRRVLDCVYSKEYRQFWESGLGLKLKMHPFGAPMALESLNSLKNTNFKRNLRASILNTSIANSKIINAPRHNRVDTERVYYTYKPYLNDEFISIRDELIECLILNGLDVTASSFIPLHKTPLMKHRQILNNNDKFPGADIYCNRIISFPAFVNEPEELVEVYAQKLNSILKQLGV